MPSQRAASQANKRMLSMEESPNAPGHPPDIKYPSETDRVIASRSLFGERKEVAIEHDGAVYRLKITKQGKLILNK
jgi:hemin uptake protein HemP